MLILQRKKNQSISIGNEITITITDIGNEQVKLAIDAPRAIPIVRGELIEAAKANQEAAASTKEALSQFANALTLQGDVSK